MNGVDHRAKHYPIDARDFQEPVLNWSTENGKIGGDLGLLEFLELRNPPVRHPVRCFEGLLAVPEHAEVGGIHESIEASIAYRLGNGSGNWIRMFPRKKQHIDRQV